MQKSFVQLAARLRGQERPSSYKRNWLTASRNSHELLDKELGRRQHEHFKSLRNARRPFFHYFRQMYTSSPYVCKPIINKYGQISPYNAVKMATNSNASWRTPWDSIGKSGYSSEEHEHRRSGKIRQDVIEPLPIEFGEDDADRTIAKLLTLRFEWDKEDELLVQRVVPSSMYALCSHSARFATKPKTKVNDGSIYDNNFNVDSDNMCLHEKENNDYDKSEVNERSNEDIDEEDCEVVYISGVKIKVRSPLPSSASSSESSSSLRRFSGVDAIPSFLLDLTRGPFLSHPQEPLLTLRWKAENRNASSVMQVIQERRKLHAISLVALPPRSLLYLTKVVACDEMEEPALDVALAVAIAENFNSYSSLECVELLRCLRRIAFVQRLLELELEEVKEKKKEELEYQIPTKNNGNKNEKEEIPLYENARLMQSVLARYAWDASPLLIERVWCRLPEMLQHLQRHHRYLDWIDVMLLSMELNGMHHLPSNLPNASSHVTSACKYLFLRYTIHMDKSFMHSLVHSFGKHHTLQLLTSNLSSSKEKQSNEATLPIRTLADGHLHNATIAERTNGLIMWTVASTLIRMVAESVGELVQYVLRVLHSYVMMMEITSTREVKETLLLESKEINCRRKELVPKNEIASNCSNPKECKEYSISNTLSAICFSELAQGESSKVPFSLFQHYTLHPYTAKLKANPVRWRLMPFVAFPTIHNVLHPPYWSITQRVLAKLENQSKTNNEEVKITKEVESTAGNLVVGGDNENKIHSAESQHEEMEQKCASTDDHLLKHHRNNALSENINNRYINNQSTCFIIQSSELLRHVQRACECLTWGTHILHCSRALIYNLPLHDGLDSANKLQLIGANENSSNNNNNDNYNNKQDFTECDKVKRQRSELCYAFARSKIQLHMDALFNFIAWKEIDSLLYEMLDKLSMQKNNKHVTRSIDDITHERQHYDGNEQRELFIDGMEEHFTSSKSHKSDDEKPQHKQTQMQQMNDVQVVELLHERVDKFEVAVADMLDEHERYFSELYEVDMTGDAGN